MIEKIFLETTINANRHFQNTETQMRIRSNLIGKKVVSSKYVIGELKNNFLRNSITFYNLLQEESNTEDALSRLSEVVYSQRQSDRVIKVFAYLMRKVGNDREELKERLDMLIEDSMEQLFYEDIDEFVDNCNCIRADARPFKEGNRWIIKIGCKQKPKPLCNITNFVEENRTEFSKIASLQQLEETKLVERLSKMLDEEIVIYGQNCWNIGDAVISMEVPQKVPIYTTNLRDFQPICSVIDKTIYQEE